ncbi:hypothetical protein C8A01DRAFT_31077 [Parachaetomium inaequale]|uniref:J domain-containing protein n=1 Tax=Parachaetomium inaequale TaxID=2588326 RepID=A0AAN6PPP4_9PEZI|nr:hypothetical protein C8A01DRAFT_31077 [Parachaetomium inaequale]
MTSTLPPDPWKALGVERDADKSEIRTAYKKLVLKCHPDKIQDPTLKALKVDEFQKVQEAWELLNDDAGLAKYQQKLRLAELQRAVNVQQDVKNSPNTSVPRTSAKYATYDIRTAEPTSRYKSSPSGGKVYTHYTTTHTRSHEEMPSSRIYPLYEEGDRQARRTASYEKPAKRDDERRERERDRDERRRRREDEELRLREKERERERDRDRERERERKKEEERSLKAEKKRLEREREKEREKDRKRDAEDKARRHKPYVEHYDTYDTYIDEIILEDEKHVTSSSRSDKKRSSSRKHDETRERERERDRDRDRDRDREREREREKSSSRRTKSPHLSSDRKHMNLYETAASYLASAGSAQSSQKGAFWMSQTPPEASFVAPLAPTPPPVEFEEESSLRQAASRAAGRRASNDPARSREKLKYETLDVTPKSRPIPTLSKSYSTPPPAPESPPRGVSRSQTAPHESYRPIPSLGRTQTWGPSSNSAAEYYDDVESEDDRDRRRHRSRRTRSPSGLPTHRYKVEGLKTSKLEPQYAYGESPNSTRYAAEALDAHVAHSPSSATYTGAAFRVKEAKAYGLNDVTYAQYEKPSYYSSHAGDGYTVTA